MVYKQSKQSVRTISNKQKVEKLIDENLILLNKEIDAHIKESGHNGTIKQLKHIIIEIEKMKTTMNPKKFTPYFSKVIIDSWDFNSELGSKLLDLVEKYDKLK